MGDGIRARMMMRCPECGTLFPTDAEHYRNVCPRCGSYLRVWTCLRCGHEWVPRNVSRPAAVCPSCHSRYWNRPRARRRS